MITWLWLITCLPSITVLIKLKYRIRVHYMSFNKIVQKWYK